MITGLVGALTGIGTIIGNAFQHYNERKIAEHQVIMAQEQARKDLAMKREEAALTLGTEQLKSTSQWFKHFTFCMWFAPFVITTFAPSYGEQIFKNWESMPEWYAQACVAIMFFIWGVQVGREYIGNIFSGAGEFFKRRQELKFNKQVFYSIMRQAKGGITQADVDLYEKAINGGFIPDNPDKPE